MSPPECANSAALAKAGQRKPRRGDQNPINHARISIMNRLPLTTKPMLLTLLIAGSFGFATTARAAGDIAAGKVSASGCAMCHGPNGEGNQMGPKLAKMDPAKFIQAMNDFKSGKRDNAMMKRLTSQLSADDISNQAAYYGSLK
jgi:cytochrome c553